MIDDAFEIVIGPEEVRALYYSVSEAIRLWPGSPARPREEQEQLQALKATLFAMVLELGFSHDGKRDEG